MIVGAFFYLAARSSYNRIVRQISRVRSPRYALAIIFGGAYLWFLMSGRGSPAGGGPMWYLTTAGGHHLATILVFLLMAQPWTFGAKTDALAFTPAELHFLFPAPVTRRELLLFKLLRSQIAILLSTLIWVFLIRNRSSAITPALTALGLWALFSTFSLHRLGAALFRASIIEHGRSGLARQRIVTALVVTFAAVLAWAAVDAYRLVAANQPDMRSAVQTIGAMLDQPFLYYVMFPFRAIAAPALASSTSDWLAAFPAALAILVAHILWVVSANVAFEESAADASARLARRIAEIRARGGRLGPSLSGAIAVRRSLPLAARGHPAVAIIWKNGLSLLRSLRLRSVLPFIIMGAVFVGVTQSVDRSETTQMMGMLLVFMFLAFSIVFGPRFVRNDLRTDLSQLSLLKTYPLTSRNIVGAEVASAAISLTLLQTSLVVVLFALSFTGTLSAPSGLDRALMLLFAPVALAVLNSVNFAIQNGAALLFPAWMTLGLNRPSGVEALGQNLLLAVASLLLMAIALIPAACGVLLAILGFAWLPTRATIVIAVLSGLVVLVVEVILLIAALGRLFERTDPSAVS